jgi:Protein of unknown function (DUF3037)
MASQYSVIQFVPDPIADERINFGVLVFDEDEVVVRFLNNWERVRCFGMADIDFLKKFAHEMNEVTASGLLFPGDRQNSDLPKQDRLMRVSQGWMNSIQFSEPHASLEPIDALVEDAVKTYLREPQVEAKSMLRDRQAAARIVTSGIRASLKQKFGDKAKELLRKGYALPGQQKEHKFDVTVANGKPLLSAHGISFEVQTPEMVIDSLAFMISDLKKSQPDFPLAIVALPPKDDSSEYRRLQKIYTKTMHVYHHFGATVLEEEQISDWTSDHLKKLHV